jgi:hypothetical protein
MNRKLIFSLIFLFSLVFALSACAGGVKGIASPLQVGDVNLQLTEAKLQDTVELSGQTLSPSSTGDIILSVTASSSKETPDLEVSVTDEDGRIDTPSVSQSVNSEGKTSLTWFFVVSRGSEKFTLHLPGDIAIPLDSLLKKAAQN